MKMTKRAHKALKGSIVKWEKIVKGTGVDAGVDNCPLCTEFVNDTDDDCLKCPVYFKTGRQGCTDTPYNEWAFSSIIINPLLGDRITNGNPTAINDAKQMLKFLKKLLPKENEK